VLELLKRRCFDQAVDLVDLALTGHNSHSAEVPSTAALPASDTAGSADAAAAMAAGVGMGLGSHPGWPMVALAQAGQLLLLEGKFDRGLTLLERCPPEVFQPCQLFYLFPDEMQRFVLWEGGRQGGREGGREGGRGDRGALADILGVGGLDQVAHPDHVLLLY
jgi:hypothetical protein